MSQFRTAIVAGASRGLAVRRGNAALLLVGAEEQANHIEEALIEIVHEVAGVPSLERGRVFGRRLLEAFVGVDPEAIPSFGAAAATSDGVAIVVHGNLTASWSSSRGAEVLSRGTEASGWVDRFVPAPVDELWIMQAGDEHVPAVNPMLDLRDGVVPAGGIVLDRWTWDELHTEPMDQLAQPEGDDQAAREESAPVIFDLNRGVGRRDPLPSVVAGEHAAPDAEQEPAVLVEGIRCPRGHFNHPEVDYCNICGIGFNQISRVTAPGPRPPLGILVLDDGSTFTLDAEYLIGREPGHDPDITSGRLRALVLDDPSQSVSRVHAEISSQGWDVTVRDRGSSNGTHVAFPSSQTWIRLERGQTLVLQPGTRLALGSRTMTFHSHHLPS